MENVPYYYFAYVLISCALAMLAVWARRRLWVRAGAVASLAVLLAVQYVALVDLLSRPKPVALEHRAGVIREARVLAAKFDEGKAIYLWLALAGRSQPRYYFLPWQHREAVDLKKSIRQAELDRSFVMIRDPFEKSLERRELPRFYATPQPRLPVKPPPEVYEYRHPSLAV